MSKKVLIIEDSRFDADIVKEFLSKDDFNIEVAMTGKEGIAKAIQMKPDLVMLDLVLPDISGYDVCKSLKKEVSLAKTIVVFLSIKDSIDDITKAFQVGADDYVIKPPIPELLARKVKLYLGVR